jgi:spore coat protein U-like protein
MHPHRTVLKPALAAVAAGCALAWAGSAGAAVTCSVTLTGLAFGVFAGAQLDSTATVTVNCSGIGGGASHPYTMAANGGGGGNISARRMVNGANQLGYQIYTNVGRTTVWGNGTTGSTVAGSSTNGVNGVFTANGRIPAAATPLPGAYTDTVTVTVTY